MRHRTGKRYDRHGRIEGLDKLLKKIEKWHEVETIIPGQIHNVKSGGRGRGLSIRVQRIDGKKITCVATRTGRKQELVVIARATARIAERIREQSWGC